jgi:hypothetical protein
MDYEYFMLVGQYPLGIANSFVWLARSKPEITINQINFICSRDDSRWNTKGSKGNEKQVIKLIKEQLNEMDLDHKIPKFNNKIITVGEADLTDASVIIGKELLNIEDNDIIIDCTGGRRAMTNAAILAAIYLIARYQKNINISYYWLMNFSRENITKKATELGLDEAIVRLFTPDQITQALEEINID